MNKTQALKIMAKKNTHTAPSDLEAANQLILADKERRLSEYNAKLLALNKEYGCQIESQIIIKVL